ncbi:MAG: potassium transporter Kup [Gammaproteobacteria bacterium]|jgi:KUP system potassium uptake protein|nr:potassium transporter Kup [Gammaproteobacteria bacterium]MBP6050358.1 potassium transporter Kup [Pseudomonadales bacterium]MBK6583723.1 potassium transporter Kup [Gammaproteobacteria bacterium]MBK7170260.1 potassium transporter Kup [Gammaproteobacteria bacterium]MBK7522062.1 potassium transporter Kup [Gammaproteobacteria bacterium]
MSNPNARTAPLTLAAMGVVYGDIGTSPLYAFKECFHQAHGLHPGRAEVFGVLSLIFWSVTAVVTLKYVVFMMRADNRGEGGSLALLSLAMRTTRNTRFSAVILVLGIFAAALFYGDSMLTPAISVLSAVEGLNLLTPVLDDYVVPLTLAIITGLFMIQRRGTASVGAWFGPIMSVWFAVLAGLGVWHISSMPSILQALNPWYVVLLFQQHLLIAFIALGSVVLALTGAEALYADMGHFGKRPIRIAWTAFVSPALVLNYFGQGALVLQEPSAMDNPLYRMVPQIALLPMILLAGMATVIASQAVISGAFSVTRMAFQLKLVPRIPTIHTSVSEEGQIYIPFINWTLFVAVVALVIGFGESSDLAAAYGVAVTGTMLIDSLLLTVVMLLSWSWNRWFTGMAALVFILVDTAFFTANSLKVPHGGWFPLAIGVVIFTLLTTWGTGRKLLIARLRESAMPIGLFLQGLADIQRVPGTAIFLTSNPHGIPPAMLHNLKHNKVIHETVILLTVHTLDRPAVAPRERLHITELGDGFYRAELDFGYLDDQNVPDNLVALAPPELPVGEMETSYFLSRERLVSSATPGMMAWREALFSWLMRNAATPLSTFHLPPNRVVELGQQIAL